ncbi:MAG: TetR/AcrR family transcriptional regulator [Bacteroidales bacterium]
MKEYITDSLLILMKTKDYKDILIGEITSKAGVHRSTYYRNFDSKEDIVRYYYTWILEEYRMQISFQDIDLKAYLLNVFTHYYHYKEQLILLHKSGLSYLMLDSLNEIFNSVYGGETMVDRYFVYYHTGGIYNNFILWFTNEMVETPEEITEYICSFFPSKFKPMLLALKKQDF